MKHLKIFKAANEWISDVKFSPDGTLLAAGSHDNNIYVYNVQGWQKKTVFNKHHSFITHLDWSKDGTCLHSDSGDYELLYWDVSKSDAINGIQEKSGKTKFRDEAWATWTTVIGWPVQGIWPPGTSGDDINAVHRSNKQTPGNYLLLAAGDDFGKVNLFRYPCIQKNSQGVKGAGHSSHVTNVRFAPNDAYLFSTGGEDNCVFQWKVSTGSGN
jgi:WD40 repeat protein